MAHELAIVAVIILIAFFIALPSVVIAVLATRDYK